MILSPEEYAAHSVYDLLAAAARLEVPVDQRFLHAVLDRGEAAVDDMLRFAMENRETDRADLRPDLISMFRHLRTPRALPFYAEYAREMDYLFEDQLTEAFVELGGAAVDTLLEMARGAIGEGGDPVDIAFTLSALGVRDPRIFEALVGSLRIQDAAEAAMNVARYGDPAAIPMLREALERAPEDDKSAREAIEDAIADLKSGRPAEEPGEPYDIWTEYPESGLPVLSELKQSEVLAFLASPEPDYRAEAVDELGYRDPEPATRDRLLEVAQADADTGVRAAAWAALAQWAEEGPVRQALESVLEDESAPLGERAGALLGLAETDHPSVLERALEFIELPESRATALRAMSTMGDPTLAGYFPNYLDDPDVEVRRAAIGGIGLYGVTSELKRLEELFDDPDLRQAALIAYASAAPWDGTRAHIQKIFARIDSLAGGLSDSDQEIVRLGFDARLAARGMRTLTEDLEEEHAHSGDEDEPGESDVAEPVQTVTAPPRVGRNDPCPCGSGKKYKKCCGK